jgi:plastocyanin
MDRDRQAGTGVIARAGLGSVVVALTIWGCASGATKRPVLHQIVIRRFLYEPNRVRAAVGDTLEWINRDLVPHSATARGGAWDSKAIPPDSSWRTVLTAPGQQPYECVFHTGMKAEIEVSGLPPSARRRAGRPGRSSPSLRFARS